MITVTERDMALKKRLFPYTSPAGIPISFQLGDREIRGIPAEFRPRVTRLTPDTTMVLTIIEGTNADGLTVRAECIEYRDYPVTEWVAYLTNNGDENTAVISDFRISGTFPGSQPVLHHGRGDDGSNESFTMTDDEIREQMTIRPSDGGRSCEGASPYMRLRFGASGTVTEVPDPYSVAIAVGWTGIWRAEYTPIGHGVRLSVRQEYFNTYIKPGETMRSPRLTLLGVDGDDKIREINIWRKWFFAHILPRDEKGQPIKPLLCEHVFAEGGEEFTGATEEQQVGGLEKYAKRGHCPDVWWIDAGWYPNNGSWWWGTGTWRADEKRFPGGLAPIGRKCEELGAKFLLWFEPERANVCSEIFSEHYDWLLSPTGKKDPEKESQCNDMLLDLGNPEAWNWITDRVDRDIKEYHIHIYRQDFNFSPAPCWRSAETGDRLGAVENQHIQGYMKYWDALRERNPGLILESCASGGRRNDLETMRRAITLHYTDVGYGNHPIKQLQHRYMFEWIPYFRAHNMSWDNENGTYDPMCDHPVPDRFAFHCAMTPSITDMTNRNVSDEDMAVSIEMTAIWREAAELMLSGDYYPLTECKSSPEDWYAMQFEDGVTGKGFIQFVRNTLAKDEEFTAYPYVNDENAVYEFSDRESGKTLTFTGKELKNGFTAKLPKRSGIVWFYQIKK